MKNFLIPERTDSKTLRIVYIVISLILSGTFIFRLLWTLWGLKFPDINSFNYSELLINFQGGFVRRGLLGEIIFQVCSITGLSPLWLIQVICFISFFIVVGFFFHKFYSLKLNWWILTTPFLLGFMVYFIRKDYLCYCILISMLYCVRGNVNSGIRLFVLLCLGILGLLIHEAFIFFGLPICTLLLLCQKGNNTIVKMIVPVVWVCIFLLLCVFKGEESVYNGIINSWQGAFPYLDISPDARAIKALSWTLGYTFDLHTHFNFHSQELGWYTTFIRIIYLFAIYFLITNFFFYFKGYSRFNEASRTLLSTLFIFSIICLLPMFVFLSCDYGRLYQYAFIAVLSSYLIIPQKYLISAFGDRILGMVERFNRYITFSPNLMKVILVAELFTLGEAPWGFSPIAGFFTTPIGTVYSALSVLYHFFIS